MGSAGCRAARLKSQSANLAACYKIHAVIYSLPRASLPLGSSVRPPVRLAWLRWVELAAVSQHGVHDDGEAPRECDRALRIVDRLAIANAQSLSFNGPL